MVLSSDVFITMLSPLITCLIFCVFATGLFFFGRRPAAVLIYSLSFFWLGVWSLPVSSSWLYEALENTYLPTEIAELPEAQAIVVLGGGIAPASESGAAPDLGAGEGRVEHASRIYHAGKAPIVFLSGGYTQDAVRSEAAGMRLVLIELDVPQQILLLEERSLNTGENAANTAAMLRERNIDNIILVTSALHMPRAKSLFEEEGLNVTPAGTDYSSRYESGKREWLPSSIALNSSTRVIKEVVGRLVGR